MSNNSEQDVAFIRALAELLHETDLTEIEVKREYGEADELKVRLSRMSQAAPAPAAPALPAPQPQAQQPARSAQKSDDGDGGGDDDSAQDAANTLTSPMVGTVYLAPEPDADDFVSVGDTVAEGDTVLIIEAMKTMNQIPAPKSGRVTKILVKNAEPCEFGAPLMVIE